MAGIRYNGVNYVYRKDAQGNIIAILDSYGNAVVEYSYDAWGNNNVGGTSVTLGNLNPFRYRGYYYDTETKLYFLQTRYYDQKIGRFINADHVDYADPASINGLNLYAYCGNNPVMYVDPTGHFVLSTFFIGLGIAMATFAVVNTASQLVGDLLNYAMTGDWESGWEEYVGAFLGGLAGGATFYFSHGNVAAIFAVMGGTETALTSLFTNASGKTNYSSIEILGKTALSVGIGFVSGKILGGTKISKITQGSNSFLAVWKSGLTKLFKGTASRMSVKVMRKGVVSIATLRIGATVTGGVMSSVIEWIKYFFGDEYAIGYLR